MQQREHFGGAGGLGRLLARLLGGSHGLHRRGSALLDLLLELGLLRGVELGDLGDLGAVLLLLTALLLQQKVTRKKRSTRSFAVVALSEFG